MGEVCDSSFFITGGPLHRRQKSHPSRPLLPFGREQGMAVCPLLVLGERCKGDCGVHMAVRQYGGQHVHCACWRHPLHHRDCFDTSFDRPPLHGWDPNKLDPKMLGHSLSESRSKRTADKPNRYSDNDKRLKRLKSMQQVIHNNQGVESSFIFCNFNCPSVFVLGCYACSLFVAICSQKALPQSTAG